MKHWFAAGAVRRSIQFQECRSGRSHFERRVASWFLVIAIVFASSCSPCPSGSKERGVKGDAQWCEVQNRDGVYVRSGPFKSWWKNGTVRAEGNYKDGKYNGVWFEDNEDGIRRWEKTYADGELVGNGKWFVGERELVAEPDLNSPENAALSFVVALNLGNEAALIRVLGNDFAKNAASECLIRKNLLHQQTESCDPSAILSRYQRLNVYARRYQVGVGALRDTKPNQAEVSITETTNDGDRTERITLYRENGLWRPAQVPPESLLPTAFEDMRFREAQAELMKGK